MYSQPFRDISSKSFKLFDPLFLSDVCLRSPPSSMYLFMYVSIYLYYVEVFFSIPPLLFR